MLMAVNQVPRALFIGVNADSEELVLRILEKDAQCIKNTDEYSIYYDWQIENKYYNAKVKLAIVNQLSKLSKPCLESVYAIVLYLDKSFDNLKVLDRIFDLLSNSDVEVKLLVYEEINSNTQFQKIDLLKWCIDKGFELVDVNEECAEDDESDTVHEKYGVDRIIEVLQTVMWPNAEISKNISQDDVLVESNNEKEHDDFCDLFSTLSAMKESVTSLPREQRLQCAKQIVSAFWNAIGGPEDELEEDLAIENVK